MPLSFASFFLVPLFPPCLSFSSSLTTHFFIWPPARHRPTFCVNAWCQVTCHVVLLLPPPRCPFHLSVLCCCLAPVWAVWAICLLVWTWAVVTLLAFQGCPLLCPHATARRIPGTLQMLLPHAALWSTEPRSHASPPVSLPSRSVVLSLWVMTPRGGGGQKAPSQGSPKTAGKH